MDPTEYAMSYVYLMEKGYTDKEIKTILEMDSNYPSKGFRKCTDFPGQTRFTKLRDAVERPCIGPDRYVSFSRVLEVLKTNPNRRFARDGWNGKGQYITLCIPAPSERVTVPYVCIRTDCGATVPWAPSQTDMLADDWMDVTDSVPSETQTGSMEV